MPGDYDPSEFSNQVSSGLPTAVAIPQASHQESTSDLAAGGGYAEFLFSIENSPILDGYVFADREMTLQLFVRLNSADTFRQLETDFVIPANILTQPFAGKRLPGSQVYILVTNNQGGPTTVFRAQFHVRSM